MKGRIVISISFWISFLYYVFLFLFSFLVYSYLFLIAFIESFSIESFSKETIFDGSSKKKIENYGITSNRVVFI